MTKPETAEQTDFEWTPVVDVAPGDTVNRWGDDLPVLRVERKDKNVRIIARETNGAELICDYRITDEIRVPSRWTPEQRSMLEARTRGAMARIMTPAEFLKRAGGED